MKFYSKQFQTLREAIYLRVSTRASNQSIIRHLSWWIKPSNVKDTNAVVHNNGSRVILGTEEQILQYIKLNPQQITSQFGELIANSARMFLSENNYRYSDNYKQQSCAFSDQSTNSYKRHFIVSGYDADGDYNRIIVSIHSYRVTVVHIVDFLHNSRSLRFTKGSVSKEEAQCKSEKRRAYQTILRDLDQHGDEIEKLMDSAKGKIYKQIDSPKLDQHSGDSDTIYSSCWKNYDTIFVIDPAKFNSIEFTFESMFRNKEIKLLYLDCLIEQFEIFSDAR
jgi:hypothetical protein